MRRPRRPGARRLHRPRGPSRRDRELIERDAEERAALAAQDDARAARGGTRDWDRDGDVDWRDRRLADDRPPYDDPPEAMDDGPVDDGPDYDPPPEDEDVIYDDENVIYDEEDVI